MRKSLLGLFLAGCCLSGLPAMADDMPIAEPAAVDEALLLPPSLEEQTHTTPADTNAIMPDSSIQPSPATASMAESKITTVNILQELDRRAREGDAACQFQLGYLYANGKGVRQDDQEAIHWYRLSARNGYPDGLIAMAEAFDLGRGVSKNPIAAYALAKAAVTTKPEAAVVANQLKAKLSSDDIAAAERMMVPDALKLK